MGAGQTDSFVSLLKGFLADEIARHTGVSFTLFSGVTFAMASISAAAISAPTFAAAAVSSAEGVELKGYMDLKGYSLSRDTL